MHIWILCAILFYGNSTRIWFAQWAKGGTDSVVGRAAGYGLDGPGIESLWRRDFPHLSRPSLGPTQPSVQRVLGLFQVKERPGRDADPSPPSSATVVKG
jgi:hypothetical protein